MAVAVRILARIVDIEFVMGVLDQRDNQTTRFQQGDDLLDEGCLAAARPAGKADKFHENAQMSCNVGTAGIIHISNSEP